MIPALVLLAALQSSKPATPSPGPVATQAPASAENPAITQIVKRELAAWQSGKIDWSHYASRAEDPAVKQVQGYLSMIGTIGSITFVQQLQRGNGRTPLSVYQLSGSKSSAYLIIGFDSGGKIERFYFMPAPPTP